MNHKIGRREYIIAANKLALNAAYDQEILRWWELASKRTARSARVRL